NLIPHYALFGNRYLYAMLPFAAIGIVAAGYPLLKREPRTRRIAIVAGLVAGVGGFVWGFYEEGYWKNSLTIWQRATEVAPQDWAGWTALGQAHLMEAMNTSLSAEERNNHLDQAETCFTTSLKCGGPSLSLGRTFFLLARVNGLQGKK